MTGPTAYDTLPTVLGITIEDYLSVKEPQLFLALP
jgi:hypothetical protein